MPERTENLHSTPFRGRITRFDLMMANRPNRLAASLEIREVGIRSIPCGFVRDFTLRPRGREHVVDFLNDTPTSTLALSFGRAARAGRITVPKCSAISW